MNKKKLFKLVIKCLEQVDVYRLEIKNSKVSNSDIEESISNIINHNINKLIK
jgi:hypothetical protein